MTRRRTRTLSALVIGTLAVTLAGCAGDGTKTPPTGPSASVATTGTNVSAEPSTSATPAAAPTCDNLTSASLNADLQKQGWSFRVDPVYLGETEIPDGIQCTWGNFSAPSNDNVQIYGWAPLDTVASEKAQADLTQDGWSSEKTDAGVYVTQDPKAARLKDDEGYGFTYLFGDGWVIFADTKQSLLLINWPR